MVSEITGKRAAVPRTIGSFAGESSLLFRHYQSSPDVAPPQYYTGWEHYITRWHWIPDWVSHLRRHSYLLNTFVYDSTVRVTNQTCTYLGNKYKKPILPYVI